MNAELQNAIDAYKEAKQARDKALAALWELDLSGESQSTPAYQQTHAEYHETHVRESRASHEVLQLLVEG